MDCQELKFPLDIEIILSGARELTAFVVRLGTYLAFCKVESSFQMSSI